MVVDHLMVPPLLVAQEHLMVAHLLVDLEHLMVELHPLRVASYMVHLSREVTLHSRHSKVTASNPPIRDMDNSHQIRDMANNLHSKAMVNNPSSKAMVNSHHSKAMVNSLHSKAMVNSRHHNSIRVQLQLAQNLHPDQPHPRLLVVLWHHQLPRWDKCHLNKSMVTQLWYLSSPLMPRLTVNC